MSGLKLHQASIAATLLLMSCAETVATPPIIPRGEHVPISIFTDMCTPGLFRLSIIFLTPWWFTVFGEWARLESSVLVLYGTHRLTAREWSPLSAPNAPIGLIHRRCINSTNLHGSLVKFSQLTVLMSVCL